MKKIISILLAAAFIVSLAACGTGADPSQSAGADVGEPDIYFEGKAELLAQAAYPVQAAYPDESKYIGSDGIFDSEKWERDTAPYYAQNAARREALASYDGGLKEYFKKAVSGFLAGNDAENAICSPVNIFGALAMLAEITDGESRQQILDLLGADSIEDVRKLAAAVWTATYQDDGAVRCLSANSLWLREDMNYNKDTMKTLADQYFASAFAGTMGDPDYTRMLQNWLDQQTGGLLSEQAGQVELTPETICAIASTMYFKGKWAVEFDESDTSSDTFHAVSGDISTDFMHMGTQGTYYFGEKFGAVNLYFEGADTSMWFYLPDEGVTPEELLADEEFLSFMTASQSEKHEWEKQKQVLIELAVPKFDVVSDMDLAKKIGELGVTDVFNMEKSDFSPLTADTDDIFVSSVKHAARVKIDEKGCEAAAFTVIMTCGATMPPADKVEFTLDRPFVFSINTSAAELPLFTGIVNTP